MSTAARQLSPAMEKAVIAALHEQGKAIGQMTANLATLIATQQQHGHTTARLEQGMTRLLGLAITQDRRMSRMEAALGIADTAEIEPPLNGSTAGEDAGDVTEEPGK